MLLVICWNGEKLLVSGDLDKGDKETPTCPAVAPSIEIEEIWWLQRMKDGGKNKIDVTQLLCNNNIMAELEALCLQKIGEDYDNAEKDEDSGGDR